jgi:hypothetical protein
MRVCENYYPLKKQNKNREFSVKVNLVERNFLMNSDAFKKLQLTLDLKNSLTSI